MSGSHVVWHGPSALDGAPVVGLLTGADESSANNKTGPMAQLWILPAGLPPHEAQRCGADESVCGDCPLRPALWRARRERGEPVSHYACYVRTWQGPLAAWRGWRSGRYAGTSLETACAALWRAGVALRLGAYGDPAALPPWVVTSLVSACSSWAGYTHRWRDPAAQWLRPLTMASAEGPADVATAESLGWRAFCADSGGHPPTWPLWTARRVTRCPASSGRATCATCGLCSGASGGRRGHVVIRSHS